jgi:hypothetical protein
MLRIAPNGTLAETVPVDMAVADTLPGEKPSSDRLALGARASDAAGGLYYEVSYMELGKGMRPRAAHRAVGSDDAHIEARRVRARVVSRAQLEVARAVHGSRYISFAYTPLYLLTSLRSRSSSGMWRGRKPYLPKNSSSLLTANTVR